MIPRAYVRHHIAGRTRLGIPERRGHEAYFRELAEGLAESFRMTRIECRPLTGSILLYHDRSLDELERVASERRLFHLVRTEVEAISTAMNRRIDRGLGGLDHAVAAATDGRVDLTSLVFAGLVGAGISQCLKGQVLPPGGTLLAKAFNYLGERVPTVQQESRSFNDGTQTSGQAG